MTQPLTLTNEQREQFLADGAVRLPGAIPPQAVEAMAARIWRALARQLGAIRDQPETWTRTASWPHPDGRPQLKQMGRPGVFAAALSPDVRALLDDFFDGRGWRVPAPWDPRPLGVVFPTTERRWNVPTRRWHVDRFESVEGRPVGVADRAWPGYVRLFAYLGPVEPGGGGTVYVAGSHRAVNLIVAERRATREGDRISSPKLVEKLKRRSPWLAELCSKGEEDEGRATRFMREGAEFQSRGNLPGIPLRVAEMTGQPGDVILWHPNLLHAPPSANNASPPRMVLSASIEAVDEGAAAGG